MQPYLSPANTVKSMVSISTKKPKVLAFLETEAREFRKLATSIPVATRDINPSCTKVHIQHNHGESKTLHNS